MGSFETLDLVCVKGTKIKGQIRGIHGERVRVRHKTKSGAVKDTWFDMEKLSPVTEKPSGK